MLANDIRSAAISDNATPEEINKVFGDTTARQVFWDKAKIVLAAMTPLIGTAGVAIIDMIQKLMP